MSEPNDTEQKIISLRVPADLMAEVEEVGREQRLSNADVMRLALVRGVAVLREQLSLPKP